MKPGFLVINKPAGVTSHDVVAAVRAVTGVKKVGHTGTLDPFATGVLPLALGPATRMIQFLDESIKVYDAVVSLGVATDTGDPTGEAVREAPVPELAEERLRDVLAGFVGDRMQRPPIYSAVKVKGRPMYSYARRGEHVEAPARPITIWDMELVSFSETTVRVMITCSRGTYARVLADQIATELGTAGHLEQLTRTRSGPFVLQESLDMPSLGEMVALEPGPTWRETLLPRRDGPRIPWKQRDEVREMLRPRIHRPLDVLSHLPLCDVDAEGAKRVRNGGRVPDAPAGVAIGGRFLVVCGDELVAIAERSERGPSTTKVVAGDAGSRSGGSKRRRRR